MPFSEPLKLTVKQKANLTCCWCQERRNKIEIHHIIPESQGGPDTEENAAPLCGSCHDLYGNNPDLRKEIRSRRDHWYESCVSGSPARNEDASEATTDAKIEFSSRYIESGPMGEFYALEITIINLGNQAIDRFKLEFTFPDLGSICSPYSSFKPVGKVEFNVQSNDTVVTTKEEGQYRVIYQSRIALFRNDRCLAGKEIGLRYWCVPKFRGSEEWRLRWKFYADKGIYKEGHISIFGLWQSSQSAGTVEVL
jgi:hypothetical protein